MMMWKVVSKTEDPARRQTDSSGSNPPSRFSVHSLVGLDNSEMDCFRRQVSTLLSWSLLIGTTNVSSISGKLLDQKENWVTQIWLLLNKFYVPKKSSLAPGLTLPPGLVMGTSSYSSSSVCLIVSHKLQIETNGYFWEKGWTFTFTNLHTSPTLFTPNLPLFYTNIYSIYVWHFLDPCLAVMVLIYGKLLALLSPHFIINFIIAITHFAFPPNPLNWRKSQKWPIGDNLSIWRLDWVRIF